MKTPTSRSLLLVTRLALFGTLVVSSATCGSDGDGTPPDSRLSRAERLRRDREQLAADLAAMEAEGLTAPYWATVDALLESGEVEPFMRVGTFTVARRDLLFLRNWNRAPRRAGALPLALDVERPGHPFAAVRSYAEQLRAHGIDLLVVPIPRCPQVYPERLPGGPTPGATFTGLGDGTAGFLLELAEAEVEAVHLLPHYAAARHADPAEADQYLFYDRNVHWTPRAAAITGSLIAERVRQFEWFEPGPAREGVDFTVYHRQTPRMLPYPTEANNETVTVWYDQVLTPEGVAAHVPDPESPILLLGDSNSMWYRREGADVASHLYARLGWRFDTITIPAGGADAVWQAVARRARSTGLSGKRLVVWIFEANVLNNPRLKPIDLFGE